MKKGLRKKVLVALILPAMLAVGLVPAFAGTGGNVAKNLSTGIEYATVQEAINAAANGQTVQMIANSTENVQVGKATDRSKVVTLDLNGKTLKSTGTVEGIRYNAITNYATLTIEDSSVDGSGKITGGTGSVKGRGSYGGGVYNSNGRLTMTGGTITGNSAGLGGGVANIQGSFTMTGGTISGNTSTGLGGGGVVNLDGGTFIMTGGSITGNTVTAGNGGGVYNDATMKVSGKPQVTGNSKGSGQSAAVNNVYLTSGKIITIGTGSGLNLAFLQKGAAFGVNTQAVPASGSPVAVTDENSKDYSEFFSSDNSSYSVINDGSDAAQVVKLGLHTHSWTYTLSEDKTSITASCGAAGQCSANDTTLTIQAPEDLVYDGSNKEANFGTATSFCGGALPNISYQYKFAESQNYADTTDTSLPGYYNASFTVGSGADAKTASIEFQLSRKQLTVSGTTVQSKTYDGTIAATVSNNGSLSGIVEGDTVSIYGVSAVFADKNVGTNKTVNVIYELQGTDAENYLAPEEGSVKADITGKQLTVTQVIMYGKTYDGTTATTAKVNSFSGVVGNDDVKVTVSSATFDNKNVDSFKKITVVYALTGDDAGNYLAPANGSGFGNIIAKAINVAADNKSSYVGSSLESLSYVADDLCSGDSWTGALSCDADNSVVDEYDILQGTLNVSDGNSGKNYAITFTPGTYTVSDKVVQSLSFQGVSDGAVSKTYGDAAFTQAVSGAQTTVTYSSTNTEVATVDSSTGEVTILKAGSTVIKASAVETAMYEAAEAQYNLTVAKVKLAVPQAATDLVYNGQQQTGVSPVTDAPYEVSGNTATNAGDYTATFSLNNTDNYEWDLSPVSTDDQDVDWSIAHKPVTVTAEDKSITLGDALPVLSAKVEGLIGSDSIDYSFKAIDVTAVGVYSISPCGTAKQGNYELVFTDGTLTVNSTAQDAPLVDTKALKDILAKYAADPAYAGKKLDVILRTDGDVNADAQTRILAKAGSAKALFFNANLFLIVTEDGQEPTSTNIGNDNSTLISVTYKFDFTGKKDIQVLRDHEGQIDVLGTQENAAGEYVVFDKDAGTVTVTACKYSVYAIAYNDASADSNTPATGDAAPLALVALACIAAGACTLFARRRLQH